jgi:DNA-directed RNA polymerase subunit RPC12/RpoP
MSLKEKVAYLKGLAEGLGLDSESKEGKLISVIIDTLSDMAEDIVELSENALDIGDELDSLSSDLADVEEFLFDDEYDDDDDYDDFFGFDDDDDDDDYDDDDFDDDECGCEFCSGGALSYETACPSCGAEIAFDESDLVHDSIKCPSCGEELEFEFDVDEEDEDEDEED